MPFANAFAPHCPLTQMGQSRLSPELGPSGAFDRAQLNTARSCSLMSPQQLALLPALFDQQQQKDHEQEQRAGSDDQPPHV